MLILSAGENCITGCRKNERNYRCENPAYTDVSQHPELNGAGAVYHPDADNGADDSLARADRHTYNGKYVGGE